MTTCQSPHEGLERAPAYRPTCALARIELNVENPSRGRRRPGPRSGCQPRRRARRRPCACTRAKESSDARSGHVRRSHRWRRRPAADASPDDSQPRRPRESWPTRWGSTSSASASTTPTTSPSPPATSCWVRSPRARRASISGRPSPSSARTTRYGSSSDTPHLDALSHGRAEVILGRGSSIESFPLFGYDLRDYEELFEEKVNLFAELRKEQPVTWRGRTRPAIDGLPVYPHTESGSIPTWIGVGGNPNPSYAAAVRVLAHARHHRRLHAAIRPVRQPVPRGARQVRVLGAAGRRALPRAHRRDRRASPRGVLALLCRPRLTSRQGTRVPGSDARDVQPRGRA